LVSQGPPHPPSYKPRLIHDRHRQSGHRQATNVAAAAEEASANVQTVAAAAEELASSITEIRASSPVREVAAKALEDAKRTNGVVQALVEGAQKIGEVIGLINNIAGQTNLLA